MTARFACKRLLIIPPEQNLGEVCSRQTTTDSGSFYYTFAIVGWAQVLASLGPASKNRSPALGSMSFRIAPFPNTNPGRTPGCSHSRAIASCDGLTPRTATRNLWEGSVLRYDLIYVYTCIDTNT